MQFRPAVLCAALALSISTPVAAGTLTFSPNQSLIDGSGTWSTANSEWWTGTTHRAWINPATGSPDTAIFGWGLAQAGTVTVQGPVRVLDLTFNQVLGSYTLSGGTLSTDLAGSARAAIWTMNDDAFVSSTVIGAFEVRGPGQLTLAGTGNNTRGATAPSVEAVVVAADARLVLGKESGPAVHAVGGKIHVVDRSRITLAGTGGDQIPDDTEIYGIGSVSSTLDLNGRSETLRLVNGGASSVSINITNSNSGTPGVVTMTGFPNNIRLADGAGPVGIVLNGGGELSQANSHSGGTTTGGQVSLMHASGLGTGPVMARSGGVVNIYVNATSGGLGEGFGGGAGGTGTITSPNAKILTVQNNFRDFQGVLAGSLELVFLGNAATYQVLSGPNTYTGPTTVNSYLSLSHPSALGATSAGTTVNTGGTLEFYALSGADTLTYADEPVTFNNGAILQVFTSGALRNAAFPGPVSLPNGATARMRVVSTNAGSLTLTGPVAGAGGVRIEGDRGPVVLGGAAKTYTGATTVGSGTLKVTTGLASTVTLGDAATGAATTRLVVDSLATFSPSVVIAATGGPAILEITNIPVVTDFTGPLTLNRPVTFVTSADNYPRATFLGPVGGSAGTLTINGGGRVVFDNSSNNFTGNIVVTGTGTTLQAGLAKSETIPNSASVHVDAGALFRLAGPAGGTETIDVLTGSGRVERHLSLGGVHTLRFGNAGGSGTFSGILADGNTAAGSLLNVEKTGSGTQTLTGPNTYTGTTTVSAGTLSLASPFLADTSTITLAAGAVLNLTHNQTDQVAALVVNGSAKPNGLYGAIGSADPADTEIAAITGTGRIRVVSALAQFQQWATTHGLTGAAAGLLADPDGDGDSNLAEFALGGNPALRSDGPLRLAKTVDSNGDGIKELTLTIQFRTGAVFSASGAAVAASVDGVTCRIEGSLGLATFDSVVSEVTPHLGTGAPPAGYQFKTFRLSASTGISGKGFLRVRMSAP